MNPLDAFDRILASLHRAALDDVHWPAASTLIEEACGAVGSVLIVGVRSGAEMRIDFARLLYRGEARDDLAREYFDVHLPHDEAPPRLWQRPIGRLTPVPDLYTKKELRTSTAYNEGWRRLQSEHGAVTHLDERDGLNIVWAFGNPLGSGGWHSAQYQLIESLVPHVRQFVRVRHALVAADALSAGLVGLLDNSGLGVLHLDRGGRVLAANALAADILRRGEGLHDSNGTLHASLPADDGRLQRLLKRALPAFGNESPVGGTMTIQRPLLRSRLGLHIHPVEAPQADFGARRVAALALVVDPESRPRIDPARVATLLGLTPSEGIVSALLAEGRAVREIAATAGFKESYVRWLLKQVYKKQGLSGQIALVQRVLTVYGLPRR